MSTVPRAPPDRLRLAVLRPCPDPRRLAYLLAHHFSLFFLPGAGPVHPSASGSALELHHRTSSEPLLHGVNYNADLQSGDLVCPGSLPLVWWPRRRPCPRPRQGITIWRDSLHPPPAPVYHARRDGRLHLFFLALSLSVLEMLRLQGRTLGRTWWAPVSVNAGKRCSSTRVRSRAISRLIPRQPLRRSALV